MASFKKSFTFYVASGMMEKVARDIVMLGNKRDGFLVTVTEKFNAKFYKFIVDHYLRKFLCFYTHSSLTHLIISFA